MQSESATTSSLHRRRVANSIFAQKIAQGARVREETHPAPCPPAMKMHSHLRYLEDPITDLSFTEKSKGKEGSLVVYVGWMDEGRKEEEEKNLPYKIQYSAVG